MGLGYLLMWDVEYPFPFSQVWDYGKKQQIAKRLKTIVVAL